MRDRLIAFLESKGFKHNDYYSDPDRENDVFFKDVDGIEFIYLLVYPHEGTKNRIMFRADAVENYDRWSNCDFQRFYVDEEDFKNNWNKYLIFDDKWCN